MEDGETKQTKDVKPTALQPILKTHTKWACSAVGSAGDS